MISQVKLMDQHTIYAVQDIPAAAPTQDSAKNEPSTAAKTNHSQIEPAEAQLDVQTMENSTVHNPADNAVHTSDHIMDHTTDPLIKQNIKQKKNKHKPTTTSDTIRFYQENFGVVSSYVATDIDHWINDLSEALVLEAMKRALEQNKVTWSYVKGILKAWAMKGIMTIEQAEADEVAFRNRQSQRMNQRSQDSGEVVPEWFKERKRRQLVEREKALDEVVVDSLDSDEQEEVERLLAQYRNRSVGV